MSVEVAAPLRIGIAGVFTLRADAAIPGSVDARHEFTLDETHATVTEKAGDNKSSTTVSATAAASSSSSAASAPAAPAKPARVTANTMASTPSDIPLSCPTDQPLAQLVRLINLAKEESDRYLTQVLNQQKAAAGDSTASSGGAKRKKKNQNGDEGEDDEEEDAEGDEEEQQSKKQKA